MQKAGFGFQGTRGPRHQPIFSFLFSFLLPPPPKAVHARTYISAKQRTKRGNSRNYSRLSWLNENLCLPGSPPARDRSPDPREEEGEGHCKPALPPLLFTRWRNAMCSVFCTDHRDEGSFRRPRRFMRRTSRYEQRASQPCRSCVCGRFSFPSCAVPHGDVSLFMSSPV